MFDYAKILFTLENRDKKNKKEKLLRKLVRAWGMNTTSIRCLQYNLYYSQPSHSLSSLTDYYTDVDHLRRRSWGLGRVSSQSYCWLWKQSNIELCWEHDTGRTSLTATHSWLSSNSKFQLVIEFCKFHDLLIIFHGLKEALWRYFYLLWSKVCLSQN